jgi:glycosyltransferase involved in cell wall biosynthesis
VIATQIGDAAFLESEAPVITIHDATFYQIMDYYPGYERSGYARETITGGVALDKMGLERAAHCIFCSNWAAKSAHQDYGIPLSKLSVAPLGANLPRIPSAEDHRSFLKQRGSGPCKFLFLGKEWYRKGGDIAVQILNELAQRGIPVELHVVGCRPDGEVPSSVKKHGELWKTVPEQAAELHRLFAASDFFILPTRAECFGLVYGEAAAYGLPVVTVGTGGVPEIVSADWGIALPPPVSTAVYADWIIAHYRDRGKYARLSNAARSAYERRLNWHTMCNHIVEVAVSLRNDNQPATEPASTV